MFRSFMYRALFGRYLTGRRMPLQPFAILYSGLLPTISAETVAHAPGSFHRPSRGSQDVVLACFCIRPIVLRRSTNINFYKENMPGNPERAEVARVAQGLAAGYYSFLVAHLVAVNPTSINSLPPATTVGWSRLLLFTFACR